MKRLILILVLLMPFSTLNAERIWYEGKYEAEFAHAYQYYWHEDFASAFREFSSLAALDDPLSQWMLAYMYQNGESVPVNYAEAIKWYRAAANQGLWLAQEKLALMYENGQGVTRDYDQALMWFRRTLAQGRNENQEHIDRIIGIQSRERAAAERARLRAQSQKRPESTERQIAKKSAPAQSQVDYRTLEESRQAARAEGNDSSLVKTENPNYSIEASPPRRSQSGRSRIANKAFEGGIVGVFLALVGTVVVLIYKGAKKAKEAAAPKVAQLKKTTLPKVKKFATRSGAAMSDRAKTQEEKVLDIGDEFFEAASDEISENTQKQGLWLKSLALAEGDETKQKAIYIRLRAKQLSETVATNDTESVPEEPQQREPRVRPPPKNKKFEEIDWKARAELAVQNVIRKGRDSGRSRTHGEEQKDKAIEAATAILELQISLGDVGDRYRLNEKLDDNYCRGYLLGFCDAFFQNAGVSDQVEMMALVTIVHLRLLGEENGSEFFGQSLQSQQDPAFHKGRTRGGQEVVEWLNNKTPTMGLASYLLHGEEPNT